MRNRVRKKRVVKKVVETSAHDWFLGFSTLCAAGVLRAGMRGGVIVCVGLWLLKTVGNV